MKELTRTKVGNFTLDKALKISEITNNMDLKKIITIEKFFQNKGIIVLSNNDIKLFLNGTKIYLNNPNDIYRIYNKDNEFIGIGIIESNLLKRDICM